MKNLLIVFALIALVSCKKNEDYKKDEWKYKMVRFTVYSPDSLKVLSGNSSRYTYFNKDGARREAYLGDLKIFRNEQHKKDHFANYKIVDGRIVDKYPPLYSTGVQGSTYYNPFDIHGLPSGAYYVSVSAYDCVHFKDKYITYNADNSNGHTEFKLYLEHGKYISGELIY